ncbi:hypothetical protein BG004_003815 [Podila humilis]|nr:hypothetical protein BG004_003815 [Podila humilis]
MATRDSFLFDLAFNANTEAHQQLATGGNPHLHHIAIEQLQAPRFDYAENRINTPKSNDLFGAIEPHLHANNASKKMHSKL